LAPYINKNKRSREIERRAPSFLFKPDILLQAKGLGGGVSADGPTLTHAIENVAPSISSNATSSGLPHFLLLLQLYKQQLALINRALRLCAARHSYGLTIAFDVDEIG
jgi:hypothetical protein